MDLELRKPKLADKTAILEMLADFKASGGRHDGFFGGEDFIYEDAFGPLQKGNTQYYVSSGIGIWGGKFRIGTRSEYVVADIK